MLGQFVKFSNSHMLLSASEGQHSLIVSEHSAILSNVRWFHPRDVDRRPGQRYDHAAWSLTSQPVPTFLEVSQSRGQNATGPNHRSRDLAKYERIASTLGTVQCRSYTPYTGRPLNGFKPTWVCLCRRKVAIWCTRLARSSIAKRTNSKGLVLRFTWRAVVMLSLCLQGGGGAVASSSNESSARKARARPVLTRATNNAQCFDQPCTLPACVRQAWQQVWQPVAQLFGGNRAYHEGALLRTRLCGTDLRLYGLYWQACSNTGICKGEAMTS